MKRVSASPHVHTSMDIRKSMLFVIIALLPSALWGVYAFGLRALAVLLVSVASALLCEFLLGLIDGKRTTGDLSAVVTGLLIGMNMPPAVPFYIPVIAACFAIFVVKWTFGGLGCNWMNPALAGRVFVFFSFSSAMSAFSAPRALAADALASATPLSAVKTAIGGGMMHLDYEGVLSNLGYSTTALADTVGNALHISPYTVDAFLGNIGGCIGEVSALLLIAGGIFLIATKVITWHIPVVYLGSFAILSWIFGGVRAGDGLFAGEVLYPLFTGGLMLGAFFIATDWVTTPTSRRGEIVFALGCGFFTFLIRYFGSLPEAVSLAIILMNILTPTIDRYIRPRKFGYVKPVKEARK